MAFKKNTVLFKFFDAANRGDFDFVYNLTEEQMKELSPFVLLMWFNGANTNPHIHTLITDMYCNEYVFSLSHHPKLLLLLFVAANSGIDSTRYSFKKSVSGEESATIKSIAEFYKVGYDVAKQYKELLDKDSIKEIKEILTP